MELEQKSAVVSVADFGSNSADCSEIAAAVEADVALSLVLVQFVQLAVAVVVAAAAAGPAVESVADSTLRNRISTSSAADSMT